MNENNGLALVEPRIIPILDPEFRPAVLANRAFRERLRVAGEAVPVRIALEQNERSVSHYRTQIFPESHPSARGNFVYLERLLKFLLWSRGGFRMYFDGPAPLARQ